MAELWTPAAEPPTELGRLRILSSTAAVRVSPLQLGAMSIGEAWKGALGSMDKESAFELLDAFYEAGGNFIDTANNYQDEQSETWLGEWMAARGNRDSVVLATKYTFGYRSHALGKTHRSANFAGNSRRSMRLSVRDSLAKLQTDYIDILYVHWWDQVTGVPELMDSLHMLVEQGAVLYLGVSDAPAWFVAACNQYALGHGRTPFSIYQGRWNVMLRDFERDILPMARHYGMALAPWDVLGGGKFQTAAAVEARRAAGEGLRSLVGPGEQTADEARMSAALARVAAEHGIESVTAVALAYVMSKAARVFPIVGGRRVEHLRDNLQALSLRLTPAQVEFLESVRPFDPGFPSTMMGPDPNVTGDNYLFNLTNPMTFPNARQETSL